MASISREKNGRRTIQFVGPNKKRRSIRLGKVPQKVAEATKVKVEHLVAAVIHKHALDAETARWVANLDTALANKLANTGLIPRRESATLGKFLDSYIDGRIDVKPRTRQWYRHAQRNLVEFFGTERSLRSLTEGDAEDWRLYLVGKGYADATIGRRCKYAKQFLSAAVRKCLIPANPFVELKGGTQENRSRDYFVTREETQKVLDTCPDGQWRLLFALARFGALRCPNEVLSLRWQDINWERDRFMVTSPKTEHHPGGGSRVIPLFPELRPYLEEVWKQAEPGTEYVITLHRDHDLRHQLRRILRLSGLKPWPKLFQNLLATRETELTETFPAHVVCRWLGHSREVAAKHYLQVTDEHYALASGGAVQNAVQQPAVPSREDS